MIGKRRRIQQSCSICQVLQFCHFWHKFFLHLTIYACKTGTENMNILHLTHRIKILFQSKQMCGNFRFLHSKHTRVALGRNIKGVNKRVQIINIEKKCCEEKISVAFVCRIISSLS